MKATWQEATIAESDETVVVEGNHYFPPSSINRESFRESSTHSTCPWKGVASYYDVVVNGKVNCQAAWYYPQTSAEARHIRDYIAFWHGVKVVP